MSCYLTCTQNGFIRLYHSSKRGVSRLSNLLRGPPKFHPILIIKNNYDDIDNAIEHIEVFKKLCRGVAEFANPQRILREGYPDFAGENQKAFTPINQLIFSEWFRNIQILKTGVIFTTVSIQWYS